MAESISWKDFELHLDNIIPGVILCWESMSLGLQAPTALHGPSAFIEGSVFVAGSYAIGLLSAMVSRNLLEALSENGLRALVFGRLVHGKRTDLVEYYRAKDPKFEADQAREKYKRWGDWISDWNSVYRSALRLSKRPDVDRRRAQGRLVRNLFFPAILGGALFAPAVSVPTWIGATFGGLLICYLYAYAELNNMAEAHDISAVEGAVAQPGDASDRS